MIPLTPALRERIEHTIRFLAVDAVQRANSGHPGAPMGLARPAFQLWDAHLRFDPSDPEWPLRDRFILSNGHASMLLYSLLHLFGYDVSHDDLVNFRQLGSKTPGHPEYGHTPGVEMTTGPLGQGFAHGVGMALAARATRARFGGASDGPGHHFVYGVVGDGDLMEGISSEAGSLAGHWGLGNLIYLFDDNRITIDGPTSISFSEDVRGRFEAQRWHVLEVDGEDVAGLDVALESARDEADRPSLIITSTVIGRGSAVAGKSAAHGAPLGAEAIFEAKEKAGWPTTGELIVPDDVKAYLADRIAAKRADRAQADVALQAWRSASPDRADAWDAARERRLPNDLLERLVDGRETVADATRNHGKDAMQRLVECVPYLIGGSADLAGSAAPPILKGKGTIGDTAEGSDAYDGVNIHFGVREHAMGAVTNGIALDGTFRPYCGTFLIFSDYVRPSLRLAALMGVPSIFVFTHDSIYLGEDGPTHQPVEQLDALRAMPNLPVFRPADGLDPRAAVDLDPRVTGAAQQRELARAELASGRAQKCSFRHVAARGPDELARGHGADAIEVNDERVPLERRVFLGDDGVGSVGHDGARRDPHGLAGAARRRRGVSGRALADARQPGEALGVGAGEDIGDAHGPAVHHAHGRERE